MVQLTYDSYIAMVNMRGNLVVAAVVLVLGIVALRVLKSTLFSKKPRVGFIVCAFIIGPVISILFFVIDVFWVSPGSYVLPQDYTSTLSRVLIIGMICGSISAMAIYLTENNCSLPQQDRNHSRVSHVDENESPPVNNSNSASM